MNAVARQVHTFKASPTLRDEPVPTLLISFDHEPPEIASGSDWEKKWRQMYENEGDLVESAMFESLPGGLYDQILRAMLARKASLLKVRHG